MEGEVQAYNTSTEAPLIVAEELPALVACPALCQQSCRDGSCPAQNATESHSVYIPKDQQFFKYKCFSDYYLSLINF